MAKRPIARGTTRKSSDRRSLVCSRCGFRAAHPAGLGRHRSAIHGIISKRQKAQRGAVPKARSTTDAQLVKRVAELERRYDRLLAGLEQLLRRAKRRG